MSDSNLVKKVIDAYAYDPEGLTQEECKALTQNQEQADALCFALGAPNGGGEITYREQEELQAVGFSPEFIQGIAGIDRNKALRERAKWLGDHVVTRPGRWDFNNKIRERFVRELGDMGYVAESAMPALSVQMRRGNPEAAIALVEIDHTATDAIPALIKALKDENAFVRSEAIRMLGRIGPDAKAAVPQLIEALKIKTTNWAAAAALSGIGPAAVPSLIETLEDACSDVRESAIRVLGEIGPAAKEAVPALIKALKDENKGIRKESARALGRIGPAAKNAVPLLIEGLKEADGSTCDFYAKALSGIGSAAILSLIAVLNDKDEVDIVRMNAAEALGDISPPTEEVVSALIAALKDEDSVVCFSVVEALGSIGPEAKAAVPVLIEALKDENVGRAAAAALGGIGPAAKAAVPALIVSLKDGGEELREDAALALGKIGPSTPEVVPALIAAMKDGDRSVRSVAAIALGRIGPAEEGVELVLRAEHEKRKKKILARLNSIPEESFEHKALSILLEAMQKLPHELFSGARFEFRPDGENRYYSGDYSVKLSGLFISVHIIAHELTHHWDDIIAPDKNLFFGRISGQTPDSVHDIINESNLSDFDSDYGIWCLGEDLTTMVEAYVGRSKILRQKIRKEMDRGNFELAAKYLFVKHVMPFAGMEYEVDKDSPALKIEEVKEAYLASKDSSKTNPGTYKIILEIEKDYPLR